MSGPDVAPWGTTDWWALPLEKDCPLSAKYSTALFTKINEPPFRDVAALFRTVLFPDVFLSNDTVIEYHDFVTSKSGTILRNASYDGLRQVPCRRDICDAVALKIDEGVVGIGILTGMGLQVLLAGLYFVMTATLLYRRRKGQDSFVIPHREESRWGDRVLFALYGSVSDFFLTSIIFDLGLAVGVLGHLATKETATTSSLGYQSATGASVIPAVPTDLQDSGASIYVANFSLLAMAGLLPTFLWDSRRKLLRGSMMFSMVWMIGSAALVWAAVTYAPSEDLRSLCQEEYLSENYSGVALASVALCVIIPPIFGAMIGIVSCCWSCAWTTMWANHRLNRIVRGFIMLFSAICYLGNLAMLVMLIIFLVGTSWFTKRTSWGVGQGLALAMWMPLLWEICYMAVAGVDKASESRMQREFFVVREGDVEGDVEDEPEFVPGSVLGPRGLRQAQMSEQAHHGTSQTTTWTADNSTDWQPAEPGHLPRPPTPPDVSTRRPARPIIRYA